MGPQFTQATCLKTCYRRLAFGPSGYPPGGYPRRPVFGSPGRLFACQLAIRSPARPPARHLASRLPAPGLPGCWPSGGVSSAAGWPFWSWARPRRLRLRPLGEHCFRRKIARSLRSACRLTALSGESGSSRHLVFRLPGGLVCWGRGEAFAPPCRAVFRLTGRPALSGESESPNRQAAWKTACLFASASRWEVLISRKIKNRRRRI